MKKIFEAIKAYSDEWSHYNNYKDFVNEFIEYNLINTDPTNRDPDYTQYLNYNAYSNPYSTKVINTVRLNIFGEEEVKNLINLDDLILLPNNTKALYNNGSELKEIDLLGGTKMYVESVEPVTKTITLPETRRRSKKRITIPLYKVQGRIKHHEEGDGKTPIKVEIYLPSEETNKIKAKADAFFNKNAQNWQSRPKFPDITNTTEEELIENQKLLDQLGTQLVKGEFYELFKDYITKFEYAYVMNNFKVQGSGIEFPFVDIYNLETGPRDKDPLHFAMYLYTLISRTKNKVFTFHPTWKANIEEGTRPICK